MRADRDELIRLVERVMNPPVGSTQEEDDLVVAELQGRLPGPGVTDLIFCPERTEGRDLLGNRSALTPDQIVDLALARKPIEL